MSRYKVKTVWTMRYFMKQKHKTYKNYRVNMLSSTGIEDELECL